VRFPCTPSAHKTNLCSLLIGDVVLDWHVGLNPAIGKPFRTFLDARRNLEPLHLQSHAPSVLSDLQADALANVTSKTDSGSPRSRIALDAARTGCDDPSRVHAVERGRIARLATCALFPSPSRSGSSKGTITIPSCAPSSRRARTCAISTLKKSPTFFICVTLAGRSITLGHPRRRSGGPDVFSVLHE
jgi:hypothetical protein